MAQVSADSMASFAFAPSLAISAALSKHRAAVCGASESLWHRAAFLYASIAFSFKPAPAYASAALPYSDDASKGFGCLAMRAAKPVFLGGMRASAAA